MKEEITKAIKDSKLTKEELTELFMKKFAEMGLPVLDESEFETSTVSI